MDAVFLPAVQNFILYAGDDFTCTLTLVQGQAETPVDLSGMSARMQFKSRTTDTTPLLELTDGNGITFVTPASGILRLDVAAAQVGTTLPVASVYYDLELTDTASKKRTYLCGVFTVKNDVSR